ncbi:MAG TPA: COX15/CtaA family protein [Nitrososphaerales archaeon]
MRGRNALLGLTVVIVFSLLVVGASVTANHYGGLCGLNTPEDWPLCNGQLFPPPDVGAVVEYAHRILASLSGLFLILTALVFWRDKDAPSGARKLVYLALISVLVEIAVGGVVVNTNLSASVVTLHQALALLVFGFTVGAAAISLRKA